MCQSGCVLTLSITDCCVSCVVCQDNYSFTLMWSTRWSDSARWSASVGISGLVGEMEGLVGCVCVCVCVCVGGGREE